MRFLLDAQISYRVAEELRAAGLDAMAASERGLDGLQDEPLWLAAIADGQTLVSYDRKDFSILYGQFWAEGVTHPGLILVTEGAIPSSDFGGLVRAIAAVAQEHVHLQDQVVYLRPA